VFTDLAVVAAQAGDPDRAWRLADSAEALAEAIANPADHVRTLSSVVAATAQAGDLDRAWRLADRAEALGGTIANPADQAWTLTGLATVIARAGDPDRAEALIDAITYPLTPEESHAKALTTLAIAAAEAGDQGRARRLADRAEALARAEAYSLDWALEGLAAALARASDPDRAEALADSMPGPGAQARELIGLVEAAADAGDLDNAGRLLARALFTAPDRIEWIETVARVFPSVAGDALNILVNAYSAHP